MQALVEISQERVIGLADAVFELECPLVFSAYSEFGHELRQLNSAEEVKAELVRWISEGRRHLSLAVWYPSMKGFARARRISVDPAKCAGHTFRYTYDGWGVIQLQLDLKRKPGIECRVAVNSEARAKGWEAQNPDSGPVSEWNWDAVEKRAQRLVRRLRALARPAASANRAKSRSG